MSTPEIANLLRAIADLIERNNPLEIASLTSAMEQGKDNRKKKSAEVSKLKEKRLPDLSTLATRILDAVDRAEATQILESENLTRRELMKLGQSHNIHIVKEDKVETIEAKIVEALVGSRLNSKAIRGEE